jgi:N-acetyl sugar amidotransferase
MTRPHQICTRCVMDTSDADILFDAEGVCSHCHKFDTIQRPQWKPDEEGARLWSAKLDEIRAKGRGKDYDCIVGLSGGVDSSYLALKAAEWGLRPLVVHVDAGWNSELATANIERVVKHCGYDLHTVVIDWPEMRDLQLAYLRAGVANQDVPQDHAFFANLYKFAIDNDVKYILSGGNIASESVIASSWEGSAMDAIGLKAIHGRYGSGKLKKYRTISFFDYYINYPILKGMRPLRPLNFMPYRKQTAIDDLTKIGWRPYGRKHGESRFTKLFQNYYLPTKFGYDKRRTHLSSLILSGDITRDDALKDLAKPLYDPAELESDIRYFCKKLNITEAEFHGYVGEPNRYYKEFPNWDSRRALVKRAQDVVSRLLGKRITAYS